MTGDIKEWLNKQQPWLQKAAFRILTKGRLEDCDIDDILDIVKQPPQTPPQYQYPSIGSVNGSAQELRLSSIGNIEGIDALNPRNPLRFDKNNLHVVYGDNGAGKSGYTRILKKLCGKPLAKDLKPNVFLPSPPNGKCDVSFNIGTQEHSSTWIANSSPIEALRAVDIFDTHTGQIYLESDTEVSYTPPELLLFSKLVGVAQLLDKNIEAEQNTLTSKLPSIPDKISKCDIGRKYGELKADSTKATIAEITTFTESDKARLELLRKMFAESPQKEVDKLSKVIKQQELVAQSLEEALRKVSVVSLKVLHKLKNTADSKRSIADQAAKALDSKSALDGVGSATWKAMWNAAKLYSVQEAYQGQSFPHTHDRANCVLCHQPLSPETSERLRTFNGFVEGAIEKDAEKAASTLKHYLEGLPAAPDKEQLQTALQAAQLPEELHLAIHSAWESITLHTEKFITEKLPESFEALPTNCADTLIALKNNLTEIKGRAEAAQRELDNFDKNTLNREGLNLAAKEWTSQQASAIRTEVARLAAYDKLSSYRKTTSTSGISRKAGSVAETLLTNAYVARFNAELGKLGASHIEVEIRKSSASKGIIKHALYLKGVDIKSKQASEILSEGENRIIALAAFLSDVTGSSQTSPFIFDDPISSLDQKYEEKTIDRLIELSQSRQVLIFTHRLSFLGILEDKTKGKFDSIHIRREPWGTGEVGSIPLYGNKPEKALNSLIRERLAKAKKVYTTEGSEAYYPLAKAICSDFRILMERIVETHLLADVVARHRRAVKTMGKIQGLTKITHDDCYIVDDIMTRYSCHEHSQSAEAPVAPPTPEILLTDLTNAKDWLEAFKKRPEPEYAN